MLVTAIIAGFLLLGLFFSMLSSAPTHAAGSLDAMNDAGHPDTAL
jgi:hypothetical protein